MARTCLRDIARLKTREECERTKRAKCVASLWLVERRISNAAIEALEGCVSVRAEDRLRLCLTYLGAPEALDILIKVDVVD
jgi:hypothetical protein